jgi:hypothetical protein
MAKMVRCMATLIFSFSVEWKPRIDYYDYYAQTSEKKPVRQTFPYVRVCSFSIHRELSCLTFQASFVHLYESGVLETFERVIIVSDGGIVDLFLCVSRITIRSWSLQSLQDSILDVLLVCTGACRRWNSAHWVEYFPNLGHNICDGHAGLLKRWGCNSDFLFLIFRAVRSAEADFEHMYNISNIMQCMGNIKRTTAVQLTFEEIIACDDVQSVVPVGDGFIKKYHHFEYVRSGVVRCKVKKSDETSKTHTMLKEAGMFHLNFVIPF